MKQLFNVYYNYENIPKILRKPMRNWFMRHRSEVVKIYNENIDRVNSEWKLTEDPWSFGDYLEDVNPSYVKHLQYIIQPIIDDVVNQKSLIFKFKIDKYGDIVGHIPLFVNSKLYITLEEVEP